MACPRSNPQHLQPKGFKWQVTWKTLARNHPRRQLPLQLDKTILEDPMAWLRRRQQRTLAELRRTCLDHIISCFGVVRSYPRRSKTSGKTLKPLSYPQDEHQLSPLESCQPNHSSHSICIRHSHVQQATATLPVLHDPAHVVNGAVA